MIGYIKLASGETLTGAWNGKQTSVHGELTFYSGMNKFQEILTDPALHGKIIVFTHPQVGISGIDPNRLESDHIHVAGVIVQDLCEKTYNEQASMSFSQFLQDQNVPFLTNVDTRALVKQIREHGEMDCTLTTADNQEIENEHTKQSINQSINTISSGQHHLIIINFGLKKSLMNSFVEQGYQVTVVPYDTEVDVIQSLQPNGLIFSGGPGNPMDYKEHFTTYQKLSTMFPTIAFGLGHQILALAFGGKVEKMLVGHRSFQHPVIDVQSKQLLLSTQNHCYSIMETSLHESGFAVRYKSVHDQTVEGLIHKQYPIFTYQFHPQKINGNYNSLIYQPFFNKIHASEGVYTYA